MALAIRNNKLTQPDDGTKEVSNIVTEPGKTVVSDEYRNPTHHLMQYGVGSPWTVKAYYRQLLGINDAMSLIDVGVIDPTQQFERIDSLIISVTNALQGSQDTETMGYELSGSGEIFNSIIPNKGDVFVVDVGDGYEGVFVVLNTERKAYNKVANYEVQYGMVFRMSPEIQATLDATTVRTFVYEPRRLALHEDPLVTKDAHSKYVSVLELEQTLKENYANDFYSPHAKTILMPSDTNQRYYDVFVADYARKLGVSHQYSSINTHNHDPYKSDELRTVWWWLATHNAHSRIHDEMRMWDTVAFRGRVSQGGIGWAPIDYTTFPKHEALKKPQAIAQGGVGHKARALPQSSEEIDLAPAQTVLNGQLTLPWYGRANDEGKYIFSAAFYAGNYSNILEYGIRCYLNKAALETSTVIELANRLYDLPELERFYYTPAVLALLHYVK